MSQSDSGRVRVSCGTTTPLRVPPASVQKTLRHRRATVVRDGIDKASRTIDLYYWRMCIIYHLLGGAVFAFLFRFEAEETRM